MKESRPYKVQPVEKLTGEDLLNARKSYMKEVMREAFKQGLIKEFTWRQVEIYIWKLDHQYVDKTIAHYKKLIENKINQAA